MRRYTNFSSKLKDITSKFLVSTVMVASVSATSTSIDYFVGINEPRTSTVIFENKVYDVTVNSEEGNVVANTDSYISSYIVDQDRDGKVDIYFRVDENIRKPIEFYGKPLLEDIKDSPTYKGIEIPKFIQEKFDKLLEIEHSNFYK